jgi:hypothetical protein
MAHALQAITIAKATNKYWTKRIRHTISQSTEVLKTDGLFVEHKSMSTLNRCFSPTSQRCFTPRQI